MFRTSKGDPVDRKVQPVLAPESVSEEQAEADAVETNQGAGPPLASRLVGELPAGLPTLVWRIEASLGLCRPTVWATK